MSFKKTKKGDLVDIIFPATCCDSSEIKTIKDYITNILQLTPNIPLEDKITPEKTEFKNSEFPSYGAQQRFQHLYQALKGNSQIIWCARGGYGSGDLLPYLEKAQPVKQNKIFIGFSDIDSIGGFLQQKWGWQTISAPILLQLSRGDISKDAENEIKALIFNQKTHFEYKLNLLNNIRYEPVEKDIIGGCLSVICGHFGGKYQINLENKILFLEDEGEDGERLDRYFRQIIELIIKTEKQPAAIILGNFKQSNLHGTPKSENIQIAINILTQRLADAEIAIPVFQVKDENLGHSSKMRPLILGKLAKIHNQGSLDILEIELDVNM